MDWNERVKDLESWSFGDSAEMADELGKLVLDGKKTATSSLHLLYEIENEPLPQVGAQQCIQDSKKRPLCIIELVSVEVMPFNQVDEEHARLEGEGDLTLSYWRKVHGEFFTKSYPQFREDMKVVCERFKVLHRF